MFLPKEISNVAITPDEIVSIIEDSIEDAISEQGAADLGVGDITVTGIVVEAIPSNIVLVGGSYLDDHIDITIASRGEDVVLSEDMLDWLNHEVAKTLVHEGIHREQDIRGRFILQDNKMTHKEYLASEIEMEAYGRADIKMDIAKNGTSVQLDEYEEIFGEDSEEVRIVKQYAGVK
jgi:hypothetical protein